jgi:hypothetical protein
VLKLNASGEVLWAKSFGDTGSHQYAMGIALTDNGDPVLTGRFYGDIDFGGGNLPTTSSSSSSTDVFVARLASSNGSHVWSASFGDDGPQNGNSIAAGEYIYLTGDVTNSFTVGNDTINAGIYSDILAVKLNMAGTPAWGQSFGGTEDINTVSDKLGHDIAVDGTGNVLLTGQFTGSVNFGDGNLTTNGGSSGFVARFNAAGEHDWSKAFGNSADLNLISRGVATDAMGNVLLTGEFSGPANFGGGDVTSAGKDLFVVKLAPNGDHLWSRRFGDAADQFGLSVAANPAGDVLVTGYFKGTLDFNTAGTSLTANGSSNTTDGSSSNTLFVAKLAK